MENIRNWFKDLSIKKSFILVVLSFTLISTIVSGIAVTEIDILDKKIVDKYHDNSAIKYYLTTEDGRRLGDGVGIIENYIEPQYTKADRTMKNFLEFFRVAVVPIVYISFTALAAIFFYTSKLKKPIEALSFASNNISQDNLEFSVDYQSKDELGSLCISFEKMRKTLEDNNIKMWRISEERRRLNAAFAHDLRTPLTVLKGYNELLVKTVTKETIQKDNLLRKINAMGRHIKRLESYVDSVSIMQKLEEFEPKFKSVDIDCIINNLKETANIIKEDKEVSFSVIDYKESSRASIDFDLFLQVFENIMSNALRFCNSKVDVMLKICESKLVLQVSDDGDGFSDKGIENATNAFYHENDNENHFGLGLYICRIICEKHMGNLKIGNLVEKGALVIAEFGF